MSNPIILGDIPVGSILAVPVMTDAVGVVVHKGVSSDRIGPDGWPMVIHKSKLFGQTLETSMTDFAARRVGPVRSEGYPSSLAPAQVLERARSQIGQPWSLSQNCEHFISWCHGFAPTSPQLQAVIAKTAITAGAIAAILRAAQSAPAKSVKRKRSRSSASRRS